MWKVLFLDLPHIGILLSTKALYILLFPVWDSKKLKPGHSSWVIICDCPVFFCHTYLLPLATNMAGMVLTDSEDEPHIEHPVCMAPKSMEMYVFKLYLAQNWTKSHDSSCKMKLFDILNKMEWWEYYVTLIFRVQGWLSIWGQILTWSFFFGLGKMVIIGWKYIKTCVE